MKKILLFAVFFFAGFLSYGQQYILQLPATTDYREFPSYVSVDYVGNDYIRVYLWGKDKYTDFSAKYPEAKLLPKPGVAKTIVMASSFTDLKNGWDKYPTYDAYLEAMQYFASNYPNLCRLDTIGTTQQGRLLLAVRITDNPDSIEQEPQFFYTSTMHGDELTGYVLMLRLIDTLLSGYGNDTFITKLVDTLDIYINPLANPDGTYAGGNDNVDSAVRVYRNGVDPNRNFGDPVNGEVANQAQETKAMIAWQREHNFVMSANFHGGAEVVNYPWDVWKSSHAHADDAWFGKIGQAYVDTARLVDPNYMTDVDSTGVTEGGDWYVISGSRQDYSNYFLHTKEITIELSADKELSSDQLPSYWNINKNSLMLYMLNAWKGFYGMVRDHGGHPQRAYIHIIGHDKDNSEVVSSYDGYYFRPVLAGSYNVVAYTDTFISDTLSVVFDGINPERLDFTLKYRVPSAEEMNDISVYPNPTSGKLMFDMLIPKVELFTLSGKHIKSWNNRIMVDISGLPEGLYLLRMTNSSGKVVYKKVILSY